MSVCVYPTVLWTNGAVQWAFLYSDWIRCLRVKEYKLATMCNLTTVAHIVLWPTAH